MNSPFDSKISKRININSNFRIVFTELKNERVEFLDFVNFLLDQNFLFLSLNSNLTEPTSECFSPNHFDFKLIDILQAFRFLFCELTWIINN